jgi:hypothetical protein
MTPVRPRALARLRTAMAALALATGPAAALGACAAAQPAPQPAPMREVSVACVNTLTMTRVDDGFCPDWDDFDDHDGYVPYFYDVDTFVEPVGHSVSGGYRTKPAGVKVYYAPVTGGKAYSVPGGPKPVPAKPAPAKAPLSPANPPAVKPAPAKPAAPRTARAGFR